MATNNTSKLTKLLNNIKSGTVILAAWLESIGISRDLQKHYRNSGWLVSIGRGAFARPGDNVTWRGGLHALQYQANINVHAGAVTALSLQGYGHYFRLKREKIFLFTQQKTVLPKWFLKHDWGNPVYHQQTSFLPLTSGVIEFEDRNFFIKISSPERAMLECLYLTPDTIDLIECFRLMEGLVNLKPKLVQELLQACKSIKVKRLFLFLGEKAGHSWVRFINTSLIDLGNGNRRIGNGGVYISKYQITIPKELAVL